MSEPAPGPAHDAAPGAGAAACPGRGHAVVIGAGPAGLAAAFELARRGRRPTVFEGLERVGGLSTTVERGGYRCDIGGHRFFTKNQEVSALWHETLGEGLLRRPRLSRILYRGTFFNYPLRPMNALRGLGLARSSLVLASWLRRKLAPIRPEDNLRDWVSNRFGRELFRIFFESYTQKVWGMPCAEISADWAAQRIRNLSLGRAVLNALGLGARGSVASLIDEFEYPRFGPGQMYEALARRAESLGARVETGSAVRRVHHDPGRVTAVEVDARGARSRVETELVVSTMPLTELVAALEPAAPAGVADAARTLRYRSIVTVNLVVDATGLPPDTWIYVHTPEVRAARVQLYRNWSPDMVPPGDTHALGLEYFANEGDAFWSRSDAETVATATEDLGRMRLAPDARVRDAFVVRYPKAYPVYDRGYRERVAAIRAYLGGFTNLACAGRYGLFRYNNMDHAVLTGLLAARRLTGEACDPWSVNEDAEYLEEKSG